ncbi:unnamed protein product [Vitrella brassicaformis CCMP3155]|uniref:Uncharacterized protein n=2 Tax=Vitrella brassicaformis TaxID=1169539 RepID=A0A0G4E8Y1_VITBC|nr:unnamed protein product [Vitrella brassicaformis CCMP3155]|eukprot:CEL92365.1 unnamed protein product [Vitrella brassicaformis CCMP3155]
MSAHHQRTNLPETLRVETPHESYTIFRSTTDALGASSRSGGGGGSRRIIADATTKKNGAAYLAVNRQDHEILVIELHPLQQKRYGRVEVERGAVFTAVAFCHIAANKHNTLELLVGLNDGAVAIYTEQPPALSSRDLRLDTEAAQNGHSSPPKQQQQQQQPEEAVFTCSVFIGRDKFPPRPPPPASAVPAMPSYGTLPTAFPFAVIAAAFNPVCSDLFMCATSSGFIWEFHRNFGTCSADGLRALAPELSEDRGAANVEVPSAVPAKETVPYAARPSSGASSSSSSSSSSNHHVQAGGTPTVTVGSQQQQPAPPPQEQPPEKRSTTSRGLSPRRRKGSGQQATTGTASEAADAEDPVSIEALTGSLTRLSEDKHEKLPLDPHNYATFAEVSPHKLPGYWVDPSRASETVQRLQRIFEAREELFCPMRVGKAGAGGHAEHRSPYRPSNPFGRWDVCTEKHPFRKSLAPTISAVAFSPDGRQLACATSQGGTRVFSYPIGKALLLVRSSYGAGLCLQWTPDSKLLLIGGEDDCISVVDVPSQQLLARCVGHNAWVKAIAMAPIPPPTPPFPSPRQSKDSTLSSQDERWSALQSPGVRHLGAWEGGASRCSSENLDPPPNAPPSPPPPPPPPPEHGIPNSSSEMVVEEMPNIDRPLRMKSSPGSGGSSRRGSGGGSVAGVVSPSYYSFLSTGEDARMLFWEVSRETLLASAANALPKLPPSRFSGQQRSGPPSPVPPTANPSPPVMIVPPAISQQPTQTTNSNASVGGASQRPTSRFKSAFSFGARRGSVDKLSAGTSPVITSPGVSPRHNSTHTTHRGSAAAGGGASSSAGTSGGSGLVPEIGPLAHTNSSVEEVRPVCMSRRGRDPVERAYYFPQVASTTVYWSKTPIVGGRWIVLLDGCKTMKVYVRVLGDGSVPWIDRLQANPTDDD